MTELIGQFHEATVEAIETSSITLTVENTQIKMNQSELDENQHINVGDTIEVFVYSSRKGEPFATTLKPYVTTEYYSYAPVITTSMDGAHVDIGLPREIIVPWQDLPRLKDVWPQQGDEILITLRVESDGMMYGRLASETIVSEIFEPIDKSKESEFQSKRIKARPYRLLKVGTFLFNDDKQKCFIHETEREEEPRLGEEVEFRVIGINEHGEINGSFLPLAHEKMDDDAEVILDYLKSHDGYMPFNDKSDPTKIKDTFNMSKSSFKRALGRLYKARKIEFKHDQTFLK